MTAEMRDQGSVTLWIDGIKEGRSAALEQIWSRYFERLAKLARRRINASSGDTGPADEEDVALSALHSLWKRAAGGKLPELQGRDDLWRLLVVITARKAVSRIRREACQKRGGGRVVDESALKGDFTHEAGLNHALAHFIADEPTPEFIVMIAEETRNRLDTLPDPVLRRVAVLRMEGNTNEEIASELGCVVRTVERKLDVIRKLWAQGTSP